MHILLLFTEKIIYIYIFFLFFWSVRTGGCQHPAHLNSRYNSCTVNRLCVSDMWVSLALTLQTTIDQLEYGDYITTKTTRDHTNASYMDTLN